jgi:hypothetical protein
MQLTILLTNVVRGLPARLFSCHNIYIIWQKEEKLIEEEEV